MLSSIFQFTEPGWIYLAHGSGTAHLPQGGSYVTLVPPKQSKNKNPSFSAGLGDFSLIIETMTHNKSVCIRPNLPSYSVEVQTVTFQLVGGLFVNQNLHIWYTYLGEDDEHFYFSNNYQTSLL